MTINRVPKEKEEKHGEHTHVALSKTLAEIAPQKTFPKWLEAIERAHRGKYTPGKLECIHVKFLNWQDVDKLQSHFMRNDFDNPHKIQIYGKYSPQTDERRQLVIARRKKEMEESPKGTKAHVKYPASVWVKKPTDKLFFF